MFVLITPFFHCRRFRVFSALLALLNAKIMKYASKCIVYYIEAMDNQEVKQIDKETFNIQNHKKNTHIHPHTCSVFNCNISKLCKENRKASKMMYNKTFENLPFFVSPYNFQLCTKLLLWANGFEIYKLSMYSKIISNESNCERLKNFRSPCTQKCHSKKKKKLISECFHQTSFRI